MRGLGPAHFFFAHFGKVSMGFLVKWNGCRKELALVFKKTFAAGWGDMDFNSHMKNTAYLDRAADVRMMYFAEHGFPMAGVMRLRIGPVIKKDEIEYFREVHLLEEFQADLVLAGLSPDGSRFLVRNRFTNC